MADKPICFVIMPITTPREYIDYYGGDEEHFEHVLEHIFAPAIRQAEYELVRPRVDNTEIIQAEIIRNLEAADLVLCDIFHIEPECIL